ncbi:putative quinol monooxygenase [Oceaniglobus indicus]|uniref:putative quinol monooxygenase n=1 Tax=Oceaniglobus indicus TaxID=2047749 RepID=UPI000C1A89F0|nr:antibiotic biosynthesis monooxygenase [Oceaniglobus indicus]
MSDNVEWVMVMDIRAGKADHARPLLDEMVETTEADEPGALHYEYYMNADETRCTSLERYEDSDAVMKHLANFASLYAERFFACFKPVSFTVYGPASDQVREALAQLGATHESRTAGFSR